MTTHQTEIQKHGWILVEEESLEPIQLNSKHKCGNGEPYVVIGGNPPHKPSSSGFVWVRTKNDMREFYPVFFNMKLVDQHTEVTV